MFTKHSQDDYRSVINGIQRKTLVHGEKTLLGEFHLPEGCLLPLHAHPNEQTGYLISGRMRFNVNGEIFEAEPGDSWCIAADVPHSAEILEDSVAIEVFAPLREDYLP